LNQNALLKYSRTSIFTVFMADILCLPLALSVPE
jgi:hypothetical protein